MKFTKADDDFVHDKIVCYNVHTRFPASRGVASRRVASTLRQYLYLIFISSAPGNCVRASSDGTREEHTVHGTAFSTRSLQERCLATMDDSREVFSSRLPDSLIGWLVSISLFVRCLTPTFPYLHFNSNLDSRGTLGF